MKKINLDTRCQHSVSYTHLDVYKRQFRVQEIHHENGVYYGQNSISKNMIIANRRHLLNGNSFILGVSGAGKSFTAKEEMVNIILTDPNADVIIIDQMCIRDRE